MDYARIPDSSAAVWPRTPLLRRLVRLALDEDLAAGDVTGDLTVDAGVLCRAAVLARQDLVVCGLPVISEIFDEYGAKGAKIQLLATEGERAASGVELAEIEADARTLLALERTILNFLQRLSGVATYARRFVDAAAGVTVLDTRKTMPGWRLLDKYAVRIGGGANHRGNLGDMVLIKNNHIDIGGGVRRTIERAAARPKGMALEVEVRDLTELGEALESQPQFVLLDNMQDAEISRAVEIVRQRSPQTRIEVSGGVTAERCARLATMGVTLVSAGALTTQAPNVDISMRISRVG